MTQEILEGDILIAEFMERRFKPYSGNKSFDIDFAFYSECMQWIIDSLLEDEYTPQLGWNLDCGKYHSSWDWLMPACYKWDNLFVETAMEYPKAMEYEKLCDEIDNAVSRYEILPVFNQLVENIKWFNQNK
jgi:hypothetical protein